MLPNALSKLLAIAVCLILLLPTAHTVYAEDRDQHVVTVVLPQVRPPFDKVFAEILNGIQEQVGGRARSIIISEDTSGEDLQALLAEKPHKPVIGLGNQVKKYLSAFNNNFQIIYGACFLNPKEDVQSVTGISLTPAPDSTFRWLNRIVPEIKTVHVVFHETTNGWIIDRAQQSAPEHELILVEHPVDSVREAASAFREILNTQDPATNAIWLMQRDPTLDEKAVVPDILAQAWSKNFVVFSSNPSHVPRGALFALYPNNEKMGRSLAQLAANSENSGVFPLSDLLIAVNVRTASHIGKNFTRKEENQFNLIFPNR